MPEGRNDDAVAQIKSRVDLVDVVSEHVRLTKRGRELLGLCPFHQEKSPSFTLNQQMQSWYCFGCQKGGDVFTFVELIDKTDFKGALESLADRTGVELQHETAHTRQRSQLRKRILELNRLAAQYYRYVLETAAAGAPGRDLLARREVDDATAARFQLGYAPSADSFGNFVRKRGHSVSDAVAAGLLRSDGRDFFRERVVIPIRDERGQTVAFVGRTVKTDEPRKYVNSPETIAYVKSRVLFALDIARDGISRRGHAVLMEGQFDVIVAHQFGIDNAIATSGTSFTADHAKLLKRFTDDLVLAFDADDAGKVAAFRAIEQAAEQRLRTRVALITGAKDPDEFLRGAGEAAQQRWQELVERAPADWEFWIRDSIRGLNTGRTADLQKALDRVHAVLKRIEDPALRHEYGVRSAQWLGIEPHLLEERKQSVNPTQVQSAAKRGVPGHERGRQTAGTYLLQILAVRPEAVERVWGKLREEDLEEEWVTFERMVATISNGGLDALNRDLGTFPATDQDLIRRAWASPPPNVDDEVVDDLVARLRRDSLQKRVRGLMTELAAAEQTGDSRRVSQLFDEHHAVARALEALNPRAR